MITGCPTCATRAKLPSSEAGRDMLVGGCPECGSEWLEAVAVEIVEARTANPPLLALERAPDLDDEARRLAEAARLAAHRHQEHRRRRRDALRGWATLGLAVAVPLMAALAFPESVTRAAPAAARLYSLAGIEVNVFGFTIRDAASELQMDSGSPLLAVRGEVVNIADEPLTVPALRFVLRDDTGLETYAWTLDGVGPRKLEPGEATSFLTRVSAPPTRAREVEIRFAHGD